MPPDFNRFTTGASRETKPNSSKTTDALLSAASVLAEMEDAYYNDDPNGLPTHFPCIAPYWSWLPDEVTAVTGWPGSGKSEFILQLMLIKSVYEKWKWALYVPENMPAKRVITKLVQSYVGQSANPKYPHRMSFAQYQSAAKWVLDHFFLVNPRKVTSLADLLGTLKQAVKDHEVHGCLIDPWNALASNLKDFGGREDEMLRHQLNDVLDFAEDFHQCVVICAHPAGEARDRVTHVLKVPDQYSISGGRMWPNKVDNFLVIHRPNADTDPRDSTVDFYAKKIKQEGFVGMKTPPEGVRFNFDRVLGRYLDPILGHAPLDVKARQHFAQHGTNNPAEVPPPKQGSMPLGTDFDTPVGYGPRTINSASLPNSN
ncbi:MAG: hypothetical protein ACRYFV_13770 [Janthinobacterium lividum]